MTSLRIAFTELQRILAGRMPRAAVLALVLVPTLYAGLYLYANHDPYAGLERVPAAIVVADRGTTDSEGTEVRAGAEVADELVEARDFDWRRVDADEAADGVDEGRYDFALTIPAGFSDALLSSARFEPRQAQLSMTTNDANSFISTTIAERVSDGVRDALAERVGTQAAERFLLGLADIRGSLVEAADGAGGLGSGATRARSGAGDLTAGARRLATGAGELEAGLAEIDERTSPLPNRTRLLANGAQEVANGNRTIAEKGNRVAALASGVHAAYLAKRQQLLDRMALIGMNREERQQVIAVYDSLGRPVREADTRIRRTAHDLRRLAGGAQRVADGADRLADAMPALVDGVGEARQGASRIEAGAGRLRGGSAELATGLGQLHTGADRLATGLRGGADEIPALDDETRSRIAHTIGDPVAVRETGEVRAGSYGAGLAPFFLALAAWIGGYVLFLLVRPLSARATAANQTPLRVALGGWLTPAIVGAAQMLAVFAVVTVAIDIVPANVPLTLLFLLLTSATFIAIVHALNAWLGSAGQFLGLVLMVLQLVTAGGTFPWQTVPEPLHLLHHALPMSYAVDGLRQLMYGGLTGLAVRDAAVLAAWLVGALVATSIAARRQRTWSVKRIRPELAL